MKLSFRVLAKFALLLVVIGFCMPIACDQNGFELADFMMQSDKTFEGLLFYLLFISAVAGVIIGVLLLMKIKLNPIIDWIAIGVCIASGLIIYFRLFNNGPDLQSGAFMILIGWIAALALQVFSKVKKE
ncbi:MAG: hypothetical protein LBI14_09595 [Treponema sp.]|jgi:hypothetical protein|nr:hypothetical protein [Treponema sp.]